MTHAKLENTADFEIIIRYQFVDGALGGPQRCALMPYREARISRRDRMIPIIIILLLPLRFQKTYDDASAKSIYF